MVALCSFATARPCVTWLDEHEILNGSVRPSMLINFLDKIVLRLGSSLFR